MAQPLDERCKAALECLPDAPYRAMLAKLLDDLRAVPLVQPAPPDEDTIRERMLREGVSGAAMSADEAHEAFGSVSREGVAASVALVELGWPPTAPSIQPLYYVAHPDGSFTVADPQPVLAGKEDHRG